MYSHTASVLFCVVFRFQISAIFPSLENSKTSKKSYITKLYNQKSSAQSLVKRLEVHQTSVSLWSKTIAKDNKTSLTIKFQVMEISVIKARNYQINVIFTGSHYYFQSPYAGVVAVAERKGYKTDEECHTFVLSAGNRHLVGGSLGGSVMFGVAEKFIRKSENKYIECVTLFERVEFDGADYRIDVTASRYDA